MLLCFFAFAAEAAGPPPPDVEAGLQEFDFEDETMNHMGGLSFDMTKGLSADTVSMQDLHLGINVGCSKVQGTACTHGSGIITVRCLTTWVSIRESPRAARGLESSEALSGSLASA